MTRMAIFLRAACGLTAALFLLGAAPGCFGKRFQEARQETVAVQDWMTGAWEGTWQDEGDEEGDALRCVIKPRADGAFDAQFNAHFAKIFTHTQDVVLTVQERGTTWRFKGQADLGFLGGGVYKYEGWTNGRDFQCRYTSEQHSGLFRLKRATAQGASPPKGHAPTTAPP